MSGDDRHYCGCKVGRVAGQYGLDDLDAELSRRRREGGESLRALAEFVNERVVAAELDALDERAGGEAFGALDLDGTAAAIHGALAGDDPERRARVRARLEQAGVDVDRVEARCVTHPTVRTHLRDCLDVDTSRSTGIDREGAIDTIEWAKARCVGVIERTVTRLDAADVVDLADPEVTVSVRVTCTECGSSFQPRELVEAGAHNCGKDAGDRGDVAE